MGWVIFSCFKNEMFCSRDRKKKAFTAECMFCQSNQTMAILGRAVFYKSRLDWILVLGLIASVTLLLKTYKGAE